MLNRKNYWKELVLLLAPALFFSTGWSQDADSTAALLYRPRGTGRTTGHVITLSIHNRSADSVRIQIGPCLIPATGKYQGYVIDRRHEGVAPPLGHAEMALMGYCTNVFKPAVPAGAGLAPFEEWAFPKASTPIPWALRPPGGEFTSLAAMPADSTWLTYPGTQTSFPYKIDFDNHPRPAAALLILAVNEIERAVENMPPSLSLLPGEKEEQRQALVQQVFWQYTARLSGGSYPFAYFQERLKEQGSLSSGRPAGSFSVETQAQLTEVAMSLWSVFEWTGAQAKLTITAGKETDWPAGYREWIRARVDELLGDDPDAPEKWRELKDTLAVLDISRNIDRLDAGDPEMFREWMDLAWLMREDFAYDYRSLKGNFGEVEGRLKEKLRNFFARQADKLDSDDPDFIVRWAELERALADDWIPGYLAAEERENLKGKLAEKFSAALWRLARAPDPAGGGFIQEWRAVDQLTKTHWFDQYMPESDKAGIIKMLWKVYRRWENTQGKLPKTAKIDWQGVHLTHSSFKIPVAAPPSPFPLWIPIAGGAVAAGAVALLTSGGGTAAPEPPVARDDEITVSCNSPATVDVLANDSGEGLRISGVDPPSGIAIGISGGSLQIADAGAAAFTFSYTIANQNGQTARAAVSVSIADNSPPVITCPADLTLDCTASVDPTGTGLATAVDNCDPAPVVTHSDVSGGTACERILSRIWRASDQVGNTAGCTQTITLIDDQAPEITCPDPVSVKLGGGISPGVTGRAGAVDNCSLPEAMDLDFEDSTAGLNGCAGTGIILRTWTAADECGNARSCTQEIQVVDDEPPQLVCPFPAAAGSLNEIDPSLTGMAAAMDNASAVDNILIAYEDEAGSLGACGGILRRRWIATDECGNAGACVQDIVISDTAPPLIACPPAAEAACQEIGDSSITGVPLAMDDYSSEDEIDIRFTDDRDELTPCGGGDLIRRWTASDACGNAGACEQLIRVRADEEAPLLICPGEVKVACGEQNNIVLTGAATASDNCSTDITLDFSDDESNLSACEGFIIRSWSAIDPCGHTASCEQIIGIEPAGAPAARVEQSAFFAYPLVSQLYPPPGLDLRRESDVREEALRSISRFLPEHPDLEAVPEFGYFIGPATGLRLGYRILPNMQFRVAWAQFDGLAFTRWTLPDQTTLMLQSPFRIGVLDFQLRREWLQGRVRPGLGLSGRRRQLTAGQSQFLAGGERQTLQDSRRTGQWDWGINGGLRWSVGPDLAIGIEGRWSPAGRWEYCLEFQHQVGASRIRSLQTTNQ